MVSLVNNLIYFSWLSPLFESATFLICSSVLLFNILSLISFLILHKYKIRIKNKLFHKIFWYLNFNLLIDHIFISFWNAKLYFFKLTYNYTNLFFIIKKTITKTLSDLFNFFINKYNLITIFIESKIYFKFKY